MKRLLLFLFCGLNVLFCDAKNTSVSNFITEANPSQIIIYIDLGENISDLNGKLDNAFSKIASSIDKTDEGLDCEVTLTIEVSVGVVSGTATVTVKGPCSEVQAKAAEIARECAEKAKKELKKLN